MFFKLGFEDASSSMTSFTSCPKITLLIGVRGISIIVQGFMKPIASNTTWNGEDRGATI